MSVIIDGVYLSTGWKSEIGVAELMAESNSIVREVCTCQCIDKQTPHRESHPS